MTSFSVLGSRRLSDQVVDTLRRAILVGEISPGQRLLETDIADQMGISRGPVREAFKVLSQQGLIVAYPHRGTFVYQLSKGEARDLLVFRASVEGLAARLVAERKSSEVLNLMARLVERMGSAADESHFEELRDLDVEFHDALAKSCGNRWVQRAWSGLHPFVWLLVGPVRPVPQEDRHLKSRHLRILDAIRSGNPDQAERAMSAHILGPESKLPAVEAWPGDDSTAIIGAPTREEILD